MLQEAPDRSNNVSAGASLFASAKMSGLCTWFEKVHRYFGHIYSEDFFLLLLQKQSRLDC